MNKREKEVFNAQLNSEKEVLKKLEQQYTRALNDIDRKIRLLQSDELTQSKIYQIEYQKALKGQISGILDKLHGDEYTTIQEYLKACYTDSFIGTMYDMAGQGIPLIMPIDQEAAIKAIQMDSKISEGLYNALGVDTKNLKKTISAEVTRGIATNMSFHDIARNIAAVSKAPMSRARTIANTEGHRIQQASAFDAQKAAAAKGADVLKQWDSTLDGKTRATHRHLDGQIRDVDMPFEADGKEAMFPGDFGDPAEDCNCRCVSLTRARWALTEKMDPDTGEVLYEDKAFEKFSRFTNKIESFDSPDDYAEFKQMYFSDKNIKYMNYVQKMEEKYRTTDFAVVLDRMTEREYGYYSKLLQGNPVFNKEKKATKHKIDVDIAGKSAILNSGNYDDLENFLASEYGLTVPQDVRKLDFAAVMESTAGLDYILKEFPQAQKMFTGIACDQTGILAADYYGVITFNPKYYASYDKVASSSGNFFNTITTAVFSNGSHEAGHLLEAALIRANRGGTTDWNQCTYAKQIVSEALKNAKKLPDGKGKKVADLIGEVSDYARQDRSECLAECVSDYSINGENAALLSKEVWKILKRELG